MIAEILDIISFVALCALGAEAVYYFLISLAKEKL